MRFARLFVGGLIAASLGACSYNEATNDFGPAYSNYTESADSPAHPGRIIGTVAYRERMALPPGAIVTVQLVETNALPPRVISEERIATGSNQPPIPFNLAYDIADIDPRSHYGLRAQITSGGRTMFASPAPTPIIPSNELDRVGLIVSFIGE